MKCICINYIFTKMCIICVFVLYSLTVQAQTTVKCSASTLVERSEESSKIKPLTIGDKVPDILFNKVLNYTSKSVKLSEFKNKLIILDMWSVFCGSCIAGFPKLEKLQEKHADKLQVLLVNPHDPKYDSEQEIIKTLTRYKNRTGYFPKLPIPIHDTILNSYFPHKSVPHQVWISPTGTVIAITNSVDLTPEKIEAVIAGNEVSIPVKDDWAFNRHIPLLVDGNGGAPGDFLYRSMFLPYRGGIGFTSGERIDSNNRIIGAYMLNKPLRLFVNEGYGEIVNRFQQNRVLFEVANPKRFSYEFQPENVYCYDISIPSTNPEDFNVNKYLREDLKRYFNISVGIEKRKTKCMIVRSIGNRLRKTNVSGKEPQYDLDDQTARKYIHNASILEIVKLLDIFESPIICDIKNSFRFDIDFPENFNLHDQQKLLTFLNEHGIKVSEKVQEIDFVVIKDR